MRAGFFLFIPALVVLHSGVGLGAFPGENGQLAFTQPVGDEGQAVFVSNLDGSDKRRVSDSPSGPPGWSPTGECLSFTAPDSQGRNQIFITDLHSPPRQLTHGKTGLSGGQWSPDGAQISASMELSHGNSDIGILDTTTGRIVQRFKMPARDYSPAWNPTKPQIAFVNESKGLLVRDLRTNQTQVLVPEQRKTLLAPDWSPAGRALVYVEQGRAFHRVMLVNASTGHRRKLYEAGELFSATYSPDGTSVLVRDNRSVFLIEVATGQARRLRSAPVGHNYAWAPLHAGRLPVTGVVASTLALWGVAIALIGLVIAKAALSRRQGVGGRIVPVVATALQRNDRERVVEDQ